jgi:hypothetical protein
MARADMSAKAVTARLLRTAQLRRLCLALRPGARMQAPAAAPGAGTAKGPRRS